MKTGKGILFSILMLFLVAMIAGCSNEGKPAVSEGTVKAITEAIKPEEFINDVLSEKDETVSLSYKLETLDSASKIPERATHALYVTAAFNGYAYGNGAVRIDSGSLLYTFYGTMNNNKFVSLSYVLKTLRSLHVSVSATGETATLDLRISESASGSYSATLTDSTGGETEIVDDSVSTSLALPEEDGAAGMEINGEPVPIPEDEPQPAIYTITYVSDGDTN